MNSQPDRTDWRKRWEARLTEWGARLRGWGLDGLAAALLEAAEPLSPLGAQALYIAQPTLGVFFPAESVARWASLLEDPANVAWLRAQLAVPPQPPVLDEEGPPDGPVDECFHAAGAAGRVHPDRDPGPGAAPPAAP